MSYEGDDRILWVGPAKSSALLEVVTVQMARGESIVIHAMPLRRKYESLLTGSS